MGYFSQAGVFLVSMLFYLYLTILMLRFMLQLVKADFYNPISQALVKLTSPPLRPLRRIIPGVYGIDMASLVLMLLVKLAEIWLLGMLLGVHKGIGQMLLLAVAGLLSLALNLMMFCIIVQIIISWINPGAYNPVTSLLYRLTEPVLAPARRILPPVAGIDFSPLVAIIVIQLAQILVVGPIHGLAGGVGPM